MHDKVPSRREHVLELSVRWSTKVVGTSQAGGNAGADHVLKPLSDSHALAPFSAATMMAEGFGAMLGSCTAARSAGHIAQHHRSGCYSLQSKLVL